MSLTFLSSLSAGVPQELPRPSRLGPQQRRAKRETEASTVASLYAFVPAAAALAASVWPRTTRRKRQQQRNPDLQRAASSTSTRAPVRPGKISSIRGVPDALERPAYLKPGTRTDPRTGLPRHTFMHVIEVKSPEKIENMRASCALAREALLVAGKAVAPGVTTDYIDSLVHEFIISNGAYPSCLGYMDFPKCCSTSVNDVIAHGIPDDRPLEDGDILNIDVTVYIGGCHGDTSSMFLVGNPEPAALDLCKAAQTAMMDGIKVCGPGVDFREIGKRIEAVADEHHLNVSDLFIGHGIGSFFHGAPEVHPYENDLDQGLMLPGMTFTVEPVLVENWDESYRVWDDKWTYQTRTNSRSAQFEHTLLITEDGCDILTGPSIDYLDLARNQSI
eukprot:TRINITY_DN21843_c0_g1_i1.p1 TRINITY_DN21843_c0_g1~~TRINITY_DN21843_c0_g1_i1.p1  ORF type:complete len:397 (-),score=59.06 TRINITY_DN21843_c0_g1_i1:16-1182(-)